MTKNYNTGHHDVTAISVWDLSIVCPSEYHRKWPHCTACKGKQREFGNEQETLRTNTTLRVAGLTVLSDNFRVHVEKKGPGVLLYATSISLFYIWGGISLQTKLPETENPICTQTYCLHHILHTYGGLQQFSLFTVWLQIIIAVDGP